MTPQRKLSIANVLMAIGITPLLLAGVFILGTLASNWKADPRHEALALTMVLSMLYTWPFAFICALPSCLWSQFVARRNPDLARGRILRRLVYVALLTPALLTAY